MKTSFLYLIIISLVVISCKIEPHEKFSQKSAYQLVNPFIGTGGHGHTFPGATLPFGMVQLSPDTRLTGWDGCSGYHNTDSIIYGFSHTHLSGTGISDYGDILLMPFNYKNTISLNDIEKQELIPSTFKKETESANPGYYKVYLDKSNTTIELTSTKRVGIHKYTFHKKENNKILLDLNHRDKVLNSEITIENNIAISGFRQSKAWASNQHVYFYIEFSEPFIVEKISTNSNKKVEQLYKILDFNDAIKELIVKVGISAVSVEGAKENLKKEAQHWDFSFYKENAKKVWSKALNKIEIKSKNEEKLTIFYSALYHTMIAPNTFSDVNGNYRGMDQKIHNDTLNTTYTVFSLWDTFRAAHPLYTIIEQEKTIEFLNTFLKHYKQGGRLPVWELSSNETECMIGYHAVSVLTDAFNKGLGNFDTEKALEAMIYGANLNHFGLESYKNNGYIRAGDEAESVSKTLEYAYDDWCIAQFAKAQGDDKTYTKFMQRAQSYKNIFDPTSNFMRAHLNGGWFKPFDPSEVNFNYTEANSWQYSLFAPQDISGLIHLFGGNDKFEQKLDDLFTTNSETTGRHQADITGLIGQYAHGNEPSHHMAYLYNFIGKPWKTQERIKQIIDEQYWNAPDGLSGNEDCGQMSAWYVLSASGFYAVTPGLNYYVIGTPAFDEITYNLENGNSFKIKANNLSESNKYIHSATLNGKKYTKSFLLHQDLMNGGKLIFEMSNTPSKEFGVGMNNMPISEIKTAFMIPIPFIDAKKTTFTKTLEITLGTVCDNCTIEYLNESEDNSTWKTYKNPLILDKTTAITAISIDENGNKSKQIVSEFIKIKPGRSITLNSEYANQYAAEGNNALINRLKGNNNFRTGFWQGYQGQDVKAIVDLGKIEEVSTISAGFLQDNHSWIWFPKYVDFYESIDGENFKKLKRIAHNFSVRKEGSFIDEFSLNTNLKTRYIKMIAKNFGVCPDWHLGAGGKSWIFIDEITIE
ncbi:MAG: GH92 family glycosyl hydrolase [Lutibacter sp.]|uniref:GH92 family glycosyl hydrolase n=1 Tax=Lutibacter sp. TaxID=1925666 RepID=UPI00385E907D